jgi:hypothetical protein
MERGIRRHSLQILIKWNYSIYIHGIRRWDSEFKKLLKVGIRKSYASVPLVDSCRACLPACRETAWVN